MNIVRTLKNQSNPFTMIDNQFINSKNLTSRAKGILLYILSKPDDWKIYETNIANNMADGIENIKAGMKELTTQGYISKEKVRVQGKFTGWAYSIIERPMCGILTEKVLTVVGVTDVGENLTTNTNLFTNTEKEEKTHINNYTSIKVCNSHTKNEQRKYISLKNFHKHIAVDTYFQLHKKKLKKKHPNLSGEYRQKAVDRLNGGIDGITMESHTWKVVMTAFFNSDIESDYNILHFTSGDIIDNICYELVN